LVSSFFGISSSISAILRFRDLDLFKVEEMVSLVADLPFIFISISSSSSESSSLFEGAVVGLSLPLARVSSSSESLSFAAIISSSALEQASSSATEIKSSSMISSFRFLFLFVDLRFVGLAALVFVAVMALLA